MNFFFKDKNIVLKYGFTNPEVRKTWEDAGKMKLDKSL